MYEKLIHQPSAANSQKSFSIRLDPIPVQEKVVYINSVCAALLDSRFGPGREWPMMTDLRRGPDREPAVFCDLTVEGPVPAYTILPDSEMARRYAAYIISQEMERMSLEAEAVNGNSISPSTQARGSPEISPGTRRNVNVVANGDKY